MSVKDQLKEFEGTDFAHINPDNDPLKSADMLDYFNMNDDFSAEFNKKYKATPISKKYRKSIGRIKGEPTHIKREIFCEHLSKLHQLRRNHIKDRESALYPAGTHVVRAVEEVCEMYKELMGFDPTWIFKEHSQLVVKSTQGREQKFTLRERQVNCAFIQLLTNRGSSETQAIKVLCKLRGDISLSSGTLKIIRMDYSDYKKNSLPDLHNTQSENQKGYWIHLTEMGYYYPEDLLEFHTYLTGMFSMKYSDEIYSDDEVSYQKAVDALKTLCSDIVKLFYMEHPEYGYSPTPWDCERRGHEYHLEWCQFKGCPIVHIFNNPTYKKFNIKDAISSWMMDAEIAMSYPG